MKLKIKISGYILLIITCLYLRVSDLVKLHDFMIFVVLVMAIYNCYYQKKIEKLEVLIKEIRSKNYDQC
jgi:hypothetical protein